MGMAIALRDILGTSMRQERHASLPTEAALLTELSAFRDRYVEFLQRYPDGQAPGAAEHIANRRAKRASSPKK